MLSDIFPDEELPPCEELTDEEIEEGIECSNNTIPAEPRYNDPIFERLLAQLWQDYQTSMNIHKEILGNISFLYLIPCSSFCKVNCIAYLTSKFSIFIEYFREKN